MSRKKRKINVIASRLKALLSLVENFSRATLTNAGATSAKWRHVVSGWGVSGGKGTASSIGALISTMFSSTDGVLRAKNPASGVGPAFWVTDSGNYWAVVKNTTNLCQTCTACGSYNSCTYCSSYSYGADSSCGCASYTTQSCCTSYSYGADSSCGCASYTTQSCCTSYSYGPDSSCGCASYSTSSCCSQYGTCTVCSSYGTQSCCTEYGYYACCTAGYSDYYYTCCQGYSSTTCCTDGFTFYSYSCCAAYGYNAYKGGVTCIQYYACSQYVCSSYGTCTTCTTYGDCVVSTCLGYGPCLQCIAYGTCTVCTGYSDQSCCTAYTTCTSCSQNNSCTYCSGYGTCTVCGQYNQCTYCSGYGTCTVCGQYNQCSHCSGYSYGADSSCGCASYYTYNCDCTDHHKIDLIKKVGGTETVVDSTTNLTTDIKGIKVTLSGNNITAQAYSDVNYSNQVGSNLTSNHPGQKSKEHGIISRASNASQGYTIDEFRVN